ncbi:MAG: dihydroneopterin aldolase [Flavitalea sp.]
MICVELRDVTIHSFHGLYEGEEKIGSAYIVNLAVTYEEHPGDLDNLSDTVDYVDLYHIVKQRMQVPAALLEKLCDSIIRHIKHQYAFVKEIKLSVFKLQPPIENFEGKLGVSMHKKFND